MLWKGFKFGMILQFAVGPVCLFVFSCGRKGFWFAEKAVVAVTCVDALFILLAVLGITSFLNNQRLKRIFMLTGALVIMVFGVSIILGALGIKLIPSFDFSNQTDSTNPWVSGFLLTAANPLTILFWAGVFTAKAMEENLNRKQLAWFAIGACSTTLFTLTLVAIAGSLVVTVIPDAAVNGLNVVVGLVLLYFAAKLLLKKPAEENNH